MSAEKPTITIEFNREVKTHSVEIDGCNGREMLLAYQSLGKKIEEFSGMPADLAVTLGAMVEEAEDAND